MRKLLLTSLLLMLSEAQALSFLGQTADQIASIFCKTYGCKKLSTTSYFDASQGKMTDVGYQLINIDAKLLLSADEDGNVFVVETLIPRSPPDEKDMAYFVNFIKLGIGSTYKRTVYDRCFEKLELSKAMGSDAEIRQMRKSGSVDESPQRPVVGEDTVGIASSGPLGASCFIRPHQSGAFTGVRVFVGD